MKIYVTNISDLACETNATCGREASSQLPTVNRAESVGCSFPVSKLNVFCYDFKFCVCMGISQFLNTEFCI